MSFRKFLCEEFNKKNRTSIIIQQLMDNLDNSHIQYSSQKIKGNIGQIIQKGSLSNLYLVIKQNESEDFSVKLGRIKNSDGYAVVISTPDILPKREAIDSYISENDDVYSGIHDCLEQFFDMGVDTSDKKTTYEKIKETNTPESFESGYQDIYNTMSLKMKECDDMVADLQKKKEFTNSDSKKHTIDLAIKNIKSSTIGNSFNEFYSIATKNHKDFIDTLDKEYISKLKERLKNYFEQIWHFITNKKGVF